MIVQVGDATVSGLVLKWRADGTAALVTYEIDGRVATDWVAVERMRPDPAVSDDGQPTSR